MTRQTFYRNLDKIRSKYSWQKNSSGEIRGFKRDLCFCPITAMIREKTGRFVCSAQADFYRDLIDFTQEDSNVIIHAADSERFYGKKIKFKCVAARRTLLRKLGLEQDKMPEFGQEDQLDSVVQAAIALNNFDQQMIAFGNKNKNATLDESSTRVYERLRTRLIGKILDYDESGGKSVDD